MINKRLIDLVPETKPHILKSILFQWVGLLCSAGAMFSLGFSIEALFSGAVDTKTLLFTVGAALVCIAGRFICVRCSSREGYLSAKPVKHVLRTRIYRKLLQLGPDYKKNLSTAELLQASSEGVEQLETYFGAYLPQFFYAILAPVTLFCALCFVSVKVAVVLIACVPLIPVSIILVQKTAKKLLGEYWGGYTKLGDSFLENLQGLTTLKLYQSDQHRHETMNREAERFRKITMRVLRMQLNSIAVMDFVAYGGAAIGIALAIIEFASGGIDVAGCFVIIALSAEFFLPMRLLGSFFHVAMNGLAASERIFALLDLPTETSRTQCVETDVAIRIHNLSYRYGRDQTALENISLTIPGPGLYAIVGASGSGKSTLCGILAGVCKGYSGSVSVGDTELCHLTQKSLSDTITLIGLGSYLFKGTVAENLRMGRPDASDAELWSALENVNLAHFVKNAGGLEFPLAERGANLSGGQQQRLALARAVLHDSRVFIFDEATSNIDIESENTILARMRDLAKTKTVILISHRLANTAGADHICVLHRGRLTGSGTHAQLLESNADYRALWDAQAELEAYTAEEAAL
jgi:ABC-type transport system involved in cytochrome bd biosynthesis fused ATPase/permease subunit